MPTHATQPSPLRRKTPRRAFTLIELVTALVVFSIVSTAICGLIFAAMKGDSYSRSCSVAQSEVELAMHRIANNIREAQSASIVTTASSLTTLTQADVANNYPNGATVAYTLVPDPNNAAQNVIMETDQRYGANPLVHNVITFNVAQVSGVPKLYQVDIVVASQTQEERHFKVYARN